MSPSPTPSVCSDQWFVTMPGRRAIAMRHNALVLQMDAALAEEEEGRLRSLASQLEEVAQEARFPADNVSIEEHLVVQHNRALVHMALGELSSAGVLLRAALLQLHLHCFRTAATHATAPQQRQGSASMAAVVESVYASVVEAEDSNVLDCILLGGLLSTAAVARSLLIALTALLTCTRLTSPHSPPSALLSTLPLLFSLSRARIASLPLSLSLFGCYPPP